MVKELRSELTVLSLLDHPYLVPFYGACLEEPNLFIVTELKSSNLHELLMDKTYHITLIEQITIAKKVASALGYLHSRGLIHRDIKSFNILVKFLI